MSLPNQLQSARIPSRQKVTLEDLGRVVKRSTEIDLEVSSPCTVVAFDSVAMTVDIVKDILYERYTADGTAIDPQLVLKGVRIHHDGQGEAGGGYLTWPIRVGAKGTFEVQDRDLGKWATTGTTNPPTLRFTHRAPAGFFRPGLRDDTRKIPSFDSVACVLESTLIKIGASAAEAAVLGDTLKAWADSLVNWCSLHTHTYNPGPGTPVITTPPTSGPGVPDPAPSAPDFLSKKVKIE